MKKVLYGGAFDLLHLGHVKAIKKAASFGDYLIVNVNSDHQIKLKKGKDRPIIPVYDRVEMLKSLRWVDQVIFYPHAKEIIIEELLETVNPDILVINAGEDTLYNRIAKKAASSRGIEIIELERQIAPSGLDTTKIIKKIRGRVL